MALSRSSVLHYWSARYGAIPVIGGQPVHTRSSSGTWTDGMGIVRSAIVNTPRFRQRTISSERRSAFVLELARTNFIAYSEDLSNAAWTKQSATISSNATVAPDGTLSADKIVETAVTDAHNVQQTVGALTDNLAQTWSGFVKAAGRDWAQFVTRTKANVFKRVWINLTNGAIGTKDASLTVEVEEHSSGWYRVLVRLDSIGSGGTTPLIAVTAAPADNVDSYAGDTSKGIYAWGIQFESNQAASSAYIPTPSSSSVTRSADSFYWDFLHVPQAAMAYVRFIERASITSNGPRIWQVGNTSDATPYWLVYASAGVYRAYVHNGSASKESAAPSTPVCGDVVELVAILFSDGSVKIIQSINGAAVGAGSQSATQSIPTAWSTPTAINLNGPNLGANDFAELKVVKYADVTASTDQSIMDELRAFELNPAGEVISDA